MREIHIEQATLGGDNIDEYFESEDDTYVVEEELGRSAYYFIREMQKFFSLPEDDGMYKSKDIVNWAKDLADQFPQSIKDFVDEHDE